MTKRVTYRDIMDCAEDWATTNAKHLGATMTQAHKAYKSWKKAGKRPREWEKALIEKWLNDEALWKCTKKSNWRRDCGR